MDHNNYKKLNGMYNNHVIYPEITRQYGNSHLIENYNLPREIPTHNISNTRQIPVRHPANNHQIPVRQPINIKENFVMKNEVKPDLTIELNEQEHYNTVTPQVFGPPLWFSLHNSAAHYPINPSPLVRNQMKNLILSLPVLIPCINCKEHATSYIESIYDKLDDICSSRDSAFKFFVDFHNFVNVRYNKPVMSYIDAYKMYLGNAKITKFSYK